jgi:hypothetical protein
MNIAACQMDDITPEDAMDRLKGLIDQMIADGEIDE